MNELFSDSKKLQSPQVQMHATFVALILKCQSVILVEKTD